MKRGRSSDLQRQRIEAAIEALSLILSKKVRSRKDAVRIVEEVYRRYALQPIRGRAWPPDIWDKELATLYAVGKYALAVHEEDSETFRTVFSVEETFEDAATVILSDRSDDEKRKLVGFLLGGDVESNSLARMFRVIATQVILGFRDERDIEELIRRTAELFPDQSDTARKYARYYIALRVAEAIASGKVRNRIEKEALKQALAARIGLPKILPDDEYIEYIARNVFGVSPRRLKSVLAQQPSRKTGQERRT